MIFDNRLKAGLQERPRPASQVTDSQLGDLLQIGPIDLIFGRIERQLEQECRGWNCGVERAKIFRSSANRGAGVGL